MFVDVEFDFADKEFEDVRFWFLFSFVKFV